jgi:hypothetical protein
MPTDLQIVRTSDFARLGAHGQLDFEKSRRALADVAKACIEKGLHHALLDVRDIYGELSTRELYRLAEAFAEMGFAKTDCLAVLHPYSGKRAEIFAAFAEERGMTVRAFESFEEAIEWFSTTVPME